MSLNPTEEVTNVIGITKFCSSSHDSRTSVTAHVGTSVIPVFVHLLTTILQTLEDIIPVRVLRYLLKSLLRIISLKGLGTLFTAQTEKSLS